MARIGPQSGQFEKFLENMVCFMKIKIPEIKQEQILRFSEGLLKTNMQIFLKTLEGG